MRAAAAIVLLSLAAQARADDPPELRAGSRVRISTEGQRGTIRGTLAALDDRRLTVESEPGAVPISVERGRITRLELSAGRRSRARGAAIGAAVGLGVGLLFTGAVSASESCNGQNDCGLGTALSLVFLTPALTVTGALVGVALPPPERWIAVPVARPPVRSNGPTPLGLRLTLRF